MSSQTAGRLPVDGRTPSRRVAAYMEIQKPNFFDPFIHKRTLRLSSCVALVTNAATNTGRSCLSETVFSFSLANFSEVEFPGHMVVLFVCLFVSLFLGNSLLFFSGWALPSRPQVPISPCPQQCSSLFVSLIVAVGYLCSLQWELLVSNSTCQHVTTSLTISFFSWWM